MARISSSFLCVVCVAVSIGLTMGMLADTPAAVDRVINLARQRFSVLPGILLAIAFAAFSSRIGKVILALIITGWQATPALRGAVLKVKEMEFGLPRDRSALLTCASWWTSAAQHFAAHPDSSHHRHGRPILGIHVEFSRLAARPIPVGRCE